MKQMEPMKPEKKGIVSKMKPVKEGLVSIIILNWNGKHFLKDCIDSILKNTSYKKFEIVVSDNGSTDGSIELLKKMKKNGKVQKLVLSGKNLGFGGGNNAGIKVSEGEFILLLNNDTKVTKNWLKPLVELADKRQDVGILGPWFPNAAHKNTIFGPGFVDNKGISRDSFKKEEGEAEMVSGGAFFVKRRVIDAIGVLDKGFFPIYFEDSDYCARARKAGFKIMFTPKSKIIHYESAATNAQPSKWKFLALNRNRIRYMLLHFPKRRLAKAAFWESLRLGKNAFSMRFPWLIEAYWLNLKDTKDIVSKRKLYQSKGYAAMAGSAKAKSTKATGTKAGCAESFEAGGKVKDIEREWNSLAKKSDNFFLSPSWLMPWIMAEEKKGNALVAIAGSKGKPLGLAFFSVENKKLGLLAQDFSYHLDFLSEKGKEKKVAEKIIEFVFANPDWKSIFFRHLVDKPLFMKALQEKCKKEGIEIALEQGDACAVVELPNTMEKYWAGLKKKLRKNQRNDLNRLGREFKIKVEIVSNAKEFEKQWKDFLRLHFENMERKGEKTVLEEEEFRAIYKQSCFNAAAEGKLRFLNLKLDNKLAGILLAIEQGKKFSVLNIGFGKNYNPKQSIGNVLFIKAIEYCCSRGIKEFDLLGGSPAYKAKFGAVLKSGLEIRIFKSEKDKRIDSLKRGLKHKAKKAMGRT